MKMLAQICGESYRIVPDHYLTLKGTKIWSTVNLEAKVITVCTAQDSQHILSSLSSALTQAYLHEQTVHPTQYKATQKEILSHVRATLRALKRSAKKIEVKALDETSK
jgi:hypothetical protein